MAPTITPSPDLVCEAPAPVIEEVRNNCGHRHGWDDPDVNHRSICAMSRTPRSGYNPGQRAIVPRGHGGILVDPKAPYYKEGFRQTRVRLSLPSRLGARTDNGNLQRRGFDAAI